MRTAHRWAALLGACGLLAAVAVAVWLGPTPTDLPGLAPPVVADGQAAGCGMELACLGPALIRTARAPCTQAIEQLAAYGARWRQTREVDPAAAVGAAGSGWVGDSRFAQLGWLDREQGTVTLSGSAVEFETGAGRSLPVRYECDFDPAAQTVLGARVQPLPGVTR